DAAMLIWLDNDTNVLGKPNENFARELQDLFTQGLNDIVTGQQNYTEQDVKEIARAFTGWNFHVNRAGGGFVPTFALNASQHDNGPKTVYGNTANYTGEDIITIVSARPATARFLTKKLFDFFVYPIDVTSSDDKSTIDKFASVYLSNDHSIQALVRSIFVSDEFYSDRAFFALVKQPAEFVVGVIRMLGGKYDPGTNVGSTTRESNTLTVSSRNMGQDLFGPPDVAGWDLNLGWVNTSGALERFNYANTFLTNRNTTVPGIYITNDQLRPHVKSSTKKTVKNFLSALGPLSVGGGTIRNLR